MIMIINEFLSRAKVDVHVHHLLPSLYADDLLKQFGDRLYHNFNGPSRAGKKTRSSWTGIYIHIVCVCTLKYFTVLSCTVYLKVLRML